MQDLGLIEPGDVHDERQLLDEAPVVALGLADAHLGLVALGERLGQRRRVVLQPLVASVERPRHLAQDRKERRVEQDERETESHDRGDRLVDLGGHGRVGLVDLEDARRPAQVAGVDGDVGLERLGVLDGGAAVVVERADLLHGLPVEGSLEVGCVVRSLAHLRVVGRAGDDALGRQQLHPQEIAEELALEDRVELGLAGGETGPAK